MKFNEKVEKWLRKILSRGKIQEVPNVNEHPVIDFEHQQCPPNLVCIELSVLLHVFTFNLHYFVASFSDIEKCLHLYYMVARLNLDKVYFIL